MYLGRVVEQGDAKIIFSNPSHPYTQALLGATPAVDPKLRRERVKLTGELPSPLNPPTGCAFHTRCRFVQEKCGTTAPPLEMQYERQVACHYAETAIKSQHDITD
jgi:dipeptide transport system ATP-binding protein